MLTANYYFSSYPLIGWSAVVSRAETRHSMIPSMMLPSLQFTGLLCFGGGFFFSLIVLFLESLEAPFIFCSSSGL